MLAAISFALTFAAILVLLSLAPRLGLLDLPDHRKHHEGAVPTVGGVALYFVLMVLFLTGTATSSATAPLLIAASIITLIGVIDDRNAINPFWRLLVQIVVALIVVYGADLRLEHLGSLTFSGERIYLGQFDTTVTIIGIVGVINAVNFIDGLDGLAGGLSLIAIAGLWVLFAVTGSAVPDLIPLLAGGLVAFLLFNARWFGRKKAALFLGDAGSTLLGLLIVWLMVDYTQGENKIISPVVALWLLAIPLIDILVIIVRRVTKGRSPFHPDREHLHHALKRITMADKHAVAILHASAIACASFGALGQLYDWPKNIMFYLFVAVFLVTFYAIKNYWHVVSLVGQSEMKQPSVDLSMQVAEVQQSVAKLEQSVTELMPEDELSDEKAL
jgi:UDP-GlcNAc:undecaprenyl-phosphate GlcNAc-1-phosphate transferase